MVINLRALQAGDTGHPARRNRRDGESLPAAGVISKVILETCYLTDEQKRLVCRVSKAEGADFVKTSTGFGAAGANRRRRAPDARRVGPQMGVKAAAASAAWRPRWR